MSGIGTLHIYAQQFSHGDAWIVGDKTALTRLRDALTRALERNGAAATTSFAADGEGYTVIVVPESQQAIEDMVLPYSKGLEFEHGLHPFSMLDDGVYRSLVRGAR